MRSMIPVMILLSLLLSSARVQAASASEATVWDLGAGLGGFSYHLYPGSRDSDTFVLPLPYFTFRSPLLEIDRGIKGYLYSSDSIELDISADFALPVDSSESDARRGMRDLDAVFQLGPSVEFILQRRGSNETRIELPLRLALASDLTRVRNLGWLTEPRISFEHDRKSRYGVAYKLTAGVLFSNEDYHAYYYDVAAADVTTQRSLYNAEGGYGGAFISARATYRFDDWVVWGYLRLSSLSGAVIDDSPLVETENYTLFGFGAAWVFAGSP